MIILKMSEFTLQRIKRYRTPTKGNNGGLTAFQRKTRKENAQTL